MCEINMMNMHHKICSQIHKQDVRSPVSVIAVFILHVQELEYMYIVITVQRCNNGVLHHLFVLQTH